MVSCYKRPRGMPVGLARHVCRLVSNKLQPDPAYD